MEKTAVSQLAPQERDELEAILRAHAQGKAGDPALVERFKSTFQDAFTGWLFLLIGSVGGIVGLLVGFGMTSIIAHARMVPMAFHEVNGLYWLARDFPLWGLPVCVIVGVWTAIVVARNYNRRGYAATSFAFVRIRAKKLALVRHTDIASIKWHHAGSRGKTFSVLDLHAAQGKPLHIYPSARWCEVAIGLMDRARVAAGLAPVKPEVTWGPYYREIQIPQSTTETTRVPTESP